MSCPRGYGHKYGSSILCEKSCPDGQYLIPLEQNPKVMICAEDCGKYMYGDKQKLTCILNCSNDTDSYHLYDTGTCVSKQQCDDKGWFISDDQKTCGPCDVIGKYLNVQRNKCVSNCRKNDNSYSFGSKCYNPCQNGMHISSDLESCVSTCGANEFINKAGTTCIKNCSNDTDSYNLAGTGTCVSKQQCDDKGLLISDQKTCSLCNVTGEFVNKAGTKCIKNCGQENAFNSNNRCYNPCPKGSYGSREDNSCVYDCGPFKYINVQGKECVSNCKKNDNSYSFGNKCYNPCPDGMHISSDSESCVFKCGANEFVSTNGHKCVHDCGKYGTVDHPSYANYNADGSRHCVESCPAGKHIAERGSSNSEGGKYWCDPNGA